MQICSPGSGVAILRHSQDRSCDGRLASYGLWEPTEQIVSSHNAALIWGQDAAHAAHQSPCEPKGLSHRAALLNCLQSRGINSRHIKTGNYDHIKHGSHQEKQIKSSHNVSFPISSSRSLLIMLTPSTIIPWKKILEAKKKGHGLSTAQRGLPHGNTFFHKCTPSPIPLLHTKGSARAFLEHPRTVSPQSPKTQPGSLFPAHVTTLFKERLSEEGT